MVRIPLENIFNIRDISTFQAVSIKWPGFFSPTRRAVALVENREYLDGHLEDFLLNSRYVHLVMRSTST
jgi:hypothetical protein